MVFHIINTFTGELVGYSLSRLCAECVAAQIMAGYLPHLHQKIGEKIVVERSKYLPKSVPEFA